MTMNPNDYDPNELRNAGEEADGVFLGGPGGRGADGSRPLGADEILQSNQYRELFLI